MKMVLVAKQDVVFTLRSEVIHLVLTSMSSTLPLKSSLYFASASGRRQTCIYMYAIFDRLVYLALGFIIKIPGTHWALYTGFMIR